MEKLFVAAGKPKGVHKKNFANHWYIVMQVHRKRSIIFDIIPSDFTGKVDQNGYLGILYVRKREYVKSRYAPKHVEVELERNFTVKDLLDVVKSEGYQNYDYNAAGGCRHYVKKVLELFERRHVIKDKSSAYEAMGKAWDFGESLLPCRPIVEGTFH